MLSSVTVFVSLRHGGVGAWGRGEGCVGEELGGCCERRPAWCVLPGAGAQAQAPMEGTCGTARPVCPAGVHQATRARARTHAPVCKRGVALLLPLHLAANHADDTVKEGGAVGLRGSACCGCGQWVKSADEGKKVKEGGAVGLRGSACCGWAVGEECGRG